jgi:SpoIID/LytB domain protein
VRLSTTRTIKRKSKLLAPLRWPAAVRASLLAVLIVALAGAARARAPWFVATTAAQAEVSDAELEQASDGRAISLGPAGGGRPVAVPLEVYVARVIAGEGEPNAPEATQQALAIAVRTYAIVNARRHARDGFDLCDGTHCQVPRTATAATRRAALTTAGRVLTYNGSPAEVFYSANCGGRSERASYVWPGADLPYLKSVVDDVHDQDVPWTLERSLREIQDVLTRNGFAGARLSDVEVTARSESGRAVRLRLRGLRPDTITGEAFRSAIGAGTLRSTAFRIERRGSVVRFTGKGYGHGVGMCVVGAGRRARRGESVERILAAYYPGLQLRDIGTLANSVSSSARRATPADPARSGAPSATPPTSTATASAGASVKPIEAAVAAGVEVIVPTSEPSAPIGDLESRTRKARAAVAAALGVAPMPVTVRLYDTIDGFRVATGRPWWVAFDRRTSSIAFGPTAASDADMLDAMLRAALAEQLMAASLADRPAWVVVGGGRYVARAVSSQAAPARLTPPAVSGGTHSGRDECPADAELTLAVSPAAQRTAEAHAEACFARAFAAAGDWRAVR